MPLPQQIEQARQAGYSDSEIADFLSTRGMIDPAKLSRARDSGYSDAETLSFLQQQSSAPVQTPERQRLQAELNRNRAAADEAGERLETTESIVENVARPLLRGITVPADALYGLPRLATNLAVRGTNKALGTEIPELQPLTSGQLAPRSTAERYGDAAVGGAASAFTGLGAGQALAQSGNLAARLVGEKLAASPIAQTVAGTTGGLSGQLARESGASPVVQAIASIAGATTPALLTAGGQAAVRGIVRGGEAGRQQVQENIDTFARAGTTPSVGQATQRRGLQATEQLLTQLPGGAGPVVRKANELADDLASRIEQNAARLAGRTSAEQAGRKISTGITGPGGFLDRFRTQQRQLYDELDQFVPPATPIGVSNTQATLQRLNKEITGAERTSQLFANPKLQAIESALKQDAAAGTLPYTAVKQLRTLVGEELAEATIVSDVSKGKLKALYGALSDDLGAAVANDAGAKQAFTRASSYTRAGLQRIELLDEVVSKAGGPEAIFRAATAGTSEGATRLRAVLQSLDDDGQKVVTATVLRRLGRATPGQQDDLAERFSTETFLTNFAKLSPEARRALFDRYGPQFRQDLDAIAKVTSNLRDGSRVFRNPSGTGQAITLKDTAFGLAVSVLTGRLDAAAGITAGVVGANLTARLMTNPNFVRFLAGTTRTPASLYTSQLNQLAQLAQETGDPELYEGLQLLEQAAPEIEQQPPNVVFANPALAPGQIAVMKAQLLKSDPNTYRALVRDFLGASYSNASPQTQDAARIRAALPAGAPEALNELVAVAQSVARSPAASTGMLSNALRARSAASLQFLTSPESLDDAGRNAALDTLTDVLLDPSRRARLREVTAIKDPQRRLMLLGAVLSGESPEIAALQLSSARPGESVTKARDEKVAAARPFPTM